MTTIHKFFCFNLWVLTKGMFCFYHCNLKLQISFGFESKQQKWRTLSWGALGRPSWGDRLLNFVEMPTMPMSPSPAREKWFWLTHLSLEWGLYWCTVNSSLRKTHNRWCTLHLGSLRKFVKNTVVAVNWCLKPSGQVFRPPKTRKCPVELGQFFSK